MSGVFRSLSPICAPLPGLPFATAARTLCSTLLLLAIAAEARPGHGLEPGSRDGPVAGLAHSECLPVNPGQCLLDGTQETTVRLAQAYFEPSAFRLADVYFYVVAYNSDREALHTLRCRRAEDGACLDGVLSAVPRGK